MGSVCVRALHHRRFVFPNEEADRGNDEIYWTEKQSGASFGDHSTVTVLFVCSF